MFARFLCAFILIFLVHQGTADGLWAGEEESHDAKEKPKPRENGAPKEAPKEGGAPEEKSEGEPSQFIKLPTFMVPVIQDRQIVSAYAIDLMIEATSKEIASQIYPLRPRLIDALFTDMYGVFCLVWSADTRVLLKDLKSRLLRVAQRVAGKKRIRSVLIQNFSEQFDRRGP